MGNTNEGNCCGGGPSKGVKRDKPTEKETKPTLMNLSPGDVEKKRASAPVSEREIGTNNSNDETSAKDKPSISMNNPGTSLVSQPQQIPAADDKAEGYFRVIEETNIDSLFEVLLRDHIQQPLTGTTNLVNRKYDAEQNLGFRVDIKEVVIDKEKHHETKIKFSMKQHPLDYTCFSHMLDEEHKRQIGMTISENELLFFAERNNVCYFFHRCLTKKIPMLAQKECFIICAYKKLPNGNYLEVYKSYEDPFWVKKDPKKKYDLMNMVIGGVYFVRPEARWEDVAWAAEMEGDFETLGGQGAWKGTIYQLINPKTSAPLSLMKGILRKSHNTVFNNQWRLIDEYKANDRFDWEKRVGFVSTGKVSMPPRGNSILTKGAEYAEDVRRLG